MKQIGVSSRSLESSWGIQNYLDISFFFFFWIFLFKVILANLVIFEKQGKVARRKIH